MISIRGLQASYGDRIVLPNIDLEVAPGEFLTLLGPSGCGKSTLLRTIAGFVPATGGSIHVAGAEVTRRAPENRGVGFVFQSYALFPHLSVRQNVAFGLQTKNVRRSEAAGRVAEILAVTDLTGFADAMPAELSGGQQQRVAIARVLVTKPSVLLMDEPLSNLDALLRVKLRAELQRLHREMGITTVYVTHDQEEALALSDRIAVMRAGNIEQLGTPTEIYNHPANQYVCNFVGSANELTSESAAVFDFPSSGHQRVFVRPERVRLGDSRQGPHAALGTITQVTFLGASTHYRVRVGEQSMSVTDVAHHRGPRQLGELVHCSFEPSDAIVLSA